MIPAQIQANTPWASIVKRRTPGTDRRAPTDLTHQCFLFVSEVRAGGLTVSQVCALFGISRKTGYKWLARHEEGGRRAFADRSGRRTRTCEQSLMSLIRFGRQVAYAAIGTKIRTGASRSCAKPPRPSALPSRGSEAASYGATSVTFWR
jgi:Helix-turn-helix domain